MKQPAHALIVLAWTAMLASPTTWAHADEPLDVNRDLVQVAAVQISGYWGFADKTALFQQCVDCQMSPKLQRLGVASIPSITHSGGFDSGAMMGVSRPLAPAQTDVRGQRVARYKSRHESYRRLLDDLRRSWFFRVVGQS